MVSVTAPGRPVEAAGVPWLAGRGVGEGTGDGVVCGTGGFAGGGTTACADHARASTTTGMRTTDTGTSDLQHPAYLNPAVGRVTRGRAGLRARAPRGRCAKLMSPSVWWV
jgi:hypothetical protein